MIETNGKKIFNAAYAAIEKYQTTNPELYTKLKKHIDMEYLSPLKFALVDFQTSYGVKKIGSWVYSVSADYKAKRAQFISIAEELGLTRGAELGQFATIEEVIALMPNK